MKVLVIGCGSIGMRHVRNLLELGVEVHVRDVDGAKVLEAAHLGAKPTFGPGNLDAALICTPADTHVAVAEYLLAVGFDKALFVEKPIGVVEPLTIFERWPHPTTMVGYNWQFHPEVRPLFQYTGSLHLVCHTTIAKWPGRAYADPILECSHEIALALAWLGDPFSVTAGSLDGGDGAWIQMQHPGGDSLTDIYWTRLPQRHYRARTKAGATIDLRVNVGPDSPALAESYKAEIRHFLEAVRSSRPTACPFSAGLRVLEICNQVRKAAA